MIHRYFQSENAAIKRLGGHRLGTLDIRDDTLNSHASVSLNGTAPLVLPLGIGLVASPRAACEHMNVFRCPARMDGVACLGRLGEELAVGEIDDEILRPAAVEGELHPASL